MKSKYGFLFLTSVSLLVSSLAEAQERGGDRGSRGFQRGNSNVQPRSQQTSPQATNNNSSERSQRMERVRPSSNPAAQAAPQRVPRSIRTQTSPGSVTPAQQSPAQPGNTAVAGSTRPDSRDARPGLGRIRSGSNPGATTSPVYDSRRGTDVRTDRNRNYPNYNSSASRGGRRGDTYVTNNYNGNNYYNHGYYNNRPSVVYNAYNPSWRYNYYPRRNTIVSVFPFSYTTINYGAYGYRYYDGLYYQPYNNAFRIVAPPIGIYINILPVGYRRIMVRDYPYYYYNGTYYNQDNEVYKVVAPPVGAIVESIPEGYETVVIDGETYYKVDDVQYKPVIQDNGEIWYEVIKVG